MKSGGPRPAGDTTSPTVAPPAELRELVIQVMTAALVRDVQAPTTQQPPQEGTRDAA